VVFGGVRYAGVRVRTAAHSESELRRRQRTRQEAVETQFRSPKLVDADAGPPGARNPVTL